MNKDFSSPLLLIKTTNVQFYYRHCDTGITHHHQLPEVVSQLREAFQIKQHVLLFGCESYRWTGSMKLKIVAEGFSGLVVKEKIEGIF